jgi:fatty-acyl-CoA synthase
MLEAHYGAPWAGAPLVTINTRLSAPEVRYIIEHSGSALLLQDPQFDDLVATATDGIPNPPVIMRAGPGDDGAHDELLAAAEPTAVPPSDERALLSVNYTSGTTGRPKGGMYHHRGAYLQALAMVTHTQLSAASAYLWTLPMFHCNGWSFPWAVTAAGGTHVCLPKVEASEIWRHIQDDHITHLCGAPAVLSMVVNAPEAGRDSEGVIRFLTGGAPPSPPAGRRRGPAYRRHAPVRTDRDVRPCGAVRLAPRMERPRRRGAVQAPCASGSRSAPGTSWRSN